MQKQTMLMISGGVAALILLVVLIVFMLKKKKTKTKSELYKVTFKGDCRRLARSSNDFSDDFRKCQEEMGLVVDTVRTENSEKDSNGNSKYVYFKKPSSTTNTMQKALTAQNMFDNAYVATTQQNRDSVSDNPYWAELDNNPNGSIENQAKQLSNKFNNHGSSATTQQNMNSVSDNPYWAELDNRPNGSLISEAKKMQKTFETNVKSQSNTQNSSSSPSSSSKNNSSKSTREVNKSSPYSIVDDDAGSVDMTSATNCTMDYNGFNINDPQDKKRYEDCMKVPDIVLDWDKINYNNTAYKRNGERDIDTYFFKKKPDSDQEFVMKQAQQMASLFENGNKVDMSESQSEKKSDLNEKCTNIYGVDKNTVLYDLCINNPDVEIDAEETQDMGDKNTVHFKRTIYSDTYLSAMTAYKNAGFV